jgi:hypothetical protein
MGFPESACLSVGDAQRASSIELSDWRSMPLDFIHRWRSCANYFSNCARDRLRVAFTRDGELHRDATTDNASRGSDEAQTHITLQLMMFDASIARAVAETSASDVDEEE